MSRRVTALVLAAVVLSVLVGSAPIGGSDASAAGVPDRVTSLLHERAQAVRSADADRWLATVEEPAVAAQWAEFAALDRLGLEAWSERLISLEDGAHGWWRAHVEVRYQLPGDQTAGVVDAVLDITPRIRIAGATAAAATPWEIAGARTWSGRHSLVLAYGTNQMLRTYAAELDRAAASVGRLLGEPPPRLTLVVPADWDQASRMIPARVTTGLAAMSTRLGPPGTTNGPVRILVPAEVLAQLEPATRTAVFGHEAFHVATNGWGPVPRWLAEGLSDFVGYRDSGIAIEQAVAGLIRHARVNGPPPALPTDAAFDVLRHATWAYEGSHLAVRMLVAEHGGADVIALYRVVAAQGGAGLDAAMREILATDVASITASWRAEVHSLAFR
jgi:hypothetical protein